MNKNITKLIIAVLVLLMSFSRLGAPSYMESVKCAEKASAAILVKGVISIENISKHGNVYLSTTCEDFFAAGYEYGDIVNVKILGKKYEMPFVKDYSNVDAGEPGVFARENESNIILAINMGDFATTFGLATKTIFEDGSFVWNYNEGVMGPIKVSIRLKNAGGYLYQYELHKLTFTNERTDYPELTDEEFANFRAVSTTGMGCGILYRSSSPIDPSVGRNVYADKALKDARVSVIVNMTDTEESIKEYEGFEDSYYSSAKHIALSMPMDYQAEDFRRGLARGFKYMARNPGVYAIHCKKGKDRTGYAVAILECLMGASCEEVIDDYMSSYYNYYGVKKGEPRYDAIAEGSIVKTLKSTFTFSGKDKKKNLCKRDLSVCAVKFLKKIGLTKKQIKRLKRNLNHPHKTR